jgi:hypothetical protein
LSHIIILVAERKPLGVATTVGEETAAPAKRGAGRRLPAKKAVAKRPVKKTGAKSDTKKKSWK